jgi:hypothetical protein
MILFSKSQIYYKAISYIVHVSYMYMSEVLSTCLDESWTQHFQFGLVKVFTFLRGRLITPTVISLTLITPTVITPTLINTPTMHPGLYHHILSNRNSKQL